ncbi:hypothetical protein [Streptomyces minutiscleroticus]|uniref:hypothetical protein n=1 Tax=Streptomyces minutiscleroticus TaxID=68238 RepID=UPI00331CEB0C
MELLLVGALAFVLPGLFARGPPLIVPTALVIATAAANGATGGKGRFSVLRSRLFLRTGRIPYCRYLTHHPLIEVASFLLDGRKFVPAARLESVVAPFALTELTSWLLRTAVINLVSGRWMRPRAATTVPEPSAATPVGTSEAASTPAAAEAVAPKQQEPTS